METIFELSDILGIIICVLPVLLTAIAIIRIVIKTRRGGHIDVPPVGVMNDLPSNADNTGMLWPANGYRSLC